MPKLQINIAKIRHNLLTLKELCKDVQIVFVSKCLRSDKEFLLALAPWKYGINTIADSYIEHLAQLDSIQAKYGFKRMLLRAQSIKNASKVINHCEIAAASEWQYLKALNKAAKRAKKRLEIMLMIDLGDLREGYFYDEKIYKILDKFAKLKHLKLHSVGSNLTCLNGVLPDVHNLSRLAAFASKASMQLGYQVLASGGNSSSLALVRSRLLPAGINELRLGDAVLTGKDCSDFSLVPGCYKDAFCLRTRIIERKRKPSMPVGTRALDAFGKEVAVKDSGMMLRVIVDVGKASSEIDAMFFKGRARALKIIGASSDCCVIDASKMPDLALDDEIKIYLEYSAILRAFAGCSMQIIYKNKKEKK